MDGSSFDALARSLTTAGSRRRALTALLSGTLGLVGAWADEATAKNCKKIKNKQKRKKCLAKATPTCTRNCAGKACGDDGCGGSCGPCVRGACLDGACLCPAGEDVCKGVCRGPCEQFTLRDPDTCGCCRHNKVFCDLGSQCCSGNCTAFDFCEGRNGLEACTWAEQCRSGVCQDGSCTCDGDICDGICRRPCNRGIRDWDTCGCCIPNNFICDTQFPCCSGTCRPADNRCEGRASGACSFNEQCASGKCEPNCAGFLCTTEKFCRPA